MDLIQKAKAIPWTRWDEITSLIEQAQDEATKEALTAIRNKKYHYEEHIVNCL